MMELADESSGDGWLTVSALARMRGVDKAAISRRVARLEAAGELSTRVGLRGTKLINVDEFNRAVERTVDAIREANGRAAIVLPRAAIREANGRRSAAASQVAEADMGDTPSDPILAREQARKTMLAADIAQLQLDELRGLLVRVADIAAGAAMQGETLARRIDQMLPEWAEDLAAIVAKDGTAGLRAALKVRARELRGALSESFAALVATPAQEEGNEMLELEVETAA
jgi:DNA-binding IscR family transcriptional regulator